VFNVCHYFLYENDATNKYEGVEDKQLLGEHITCTSLGSLVYAYNYKRTVVDKWWKLLWSDCLGLPGNFIFYLILEKNGRLFLGSENS
jgi:hypothetical protein